MAIHPGRPAADRPELVGFERQPMVRWFSPGELVSAGLRVLLSGIFGAYSDKREIQAALEKSIVFDYHTGNEELWVDYVSDLGDGFDATYTMACLLAAENLELARPGGAGPLVTPRGKVLVMGGDQVYPTATTDAYQDRLLGPYRAALPYVEPGEAHPDVFAVPGNHDWYDGLTSFLRVFCRQQWIGGWRTRQSRSYFALQLPHRWWLWGIDIQFDTYIDEPQFDFFTEKVPVKPGDSVILCSAKPSWVHARKEPEAFATLDFFERKAIRDRGAHLRLSLSGDAHHYAHYADPEHGAHRITAGGGGAFLAATHHLAKELELPPSASKDPGKSSPPARFTRGQVYPSNKASRRKLSFGVFRLPAKNPSFCFLMSALYLVYALVIQGAIRRPGRDWGGGLESVGFVDALTALRNPGGIILSVVVLAGLAGFTKSHDPAKKWSLGLVHTVGHLAAVAGTVLLAAAWAQSLHGELFVVAFLALVAVVGGVLGSLVMAAYLLLADRFECNTNELFAAQRIEDHKNFVRLHVRDDKSLEVYPVMVQRVGRKWKLKPKGQGAEDDPWFAADEPGTAPVLMEAPIVIPPAGQP